MFQGSRAKPWELTGGRPPISRKDILKGFKRHSFDFWSVVHRAKQQRQLKKTKTNGWSVCVMRHESCVTINTSYITFGSYSFSESYVSDDVRRKKIIEALDLIGELGLEIIDHGYVGKDYWLTFKNKKQASLYVLFADD